MIRLHGRATPTGLDGEIYPDVWRVCRGDENGTGDALACLSTGRDVIGDRNQIYLTSIRRLPLLVPLSDWDAGYPILAKTTFCTSRRMAHG